MCIASKEWDKHGQAQCSRRLCPALNQTSLGQPGHTIEWVGRSWALAHCVSQKPSSIPVNGEARGFTLPATPCKFLCLTRHWRDYMTPHYDFSTTVRNDSSTSVFQPSKLSTAWSICSCGLILYDDVRETEPDSKHNTCFIKTIQVTWQLEMKSNESC